jgi:hypothetical protein
MLSYLTSPDEPRWTRWLLLVFVPLLLLYYVAANGNSETKNDDVYANDQKVYLNTASRIANDPSGYFTPRQRTPGYPYFLSLFYSKDKFNVPDGSKPPFAPAWFERGKTINLVLSVFLLAGLFLFCRRLLPIVESGLVTVASGLLLFTFKAAYVQPELSYWVLNTILFVRLGKMLLAPGWRLAVGCGLLSVVAYFVKAGTQPLLFLFVVTWAIKLLWDWISYRRRNGSGRLDVGEEAPRTGIVALQGALVIAIYLLLLIPYFSGTKKQFGDPFFSVYTEYMMWLPMEGDGFLVDRDYMWAFYYAGARSRPITVDEFNTSLERATRSRLKGEAKGRLSGAELDALVAEDFHPVSELPSRENYFARYSLVHSADRVVHGLTMLNKRIKKYYKRAMTMLAYVVKLALVALALRVAMWCWERYCPGRVFFVEDRSPPEVPRPWALLARRPYLLFYAAGFFCGYLVLYAWYDALGIGPRLMLSLYLPGLVMAVWALRWLCAGLVVPRLPGGRLLFLGKVANLLLVAALVYLSIKLMTGELYQYSNTGG